LVKKKTDYQMRTLTAYGMGVVIVLALVNGMASRNASVAQHDVFSAEFVLGMLGTYLHALRISPGGLISN
jgi:hypothetical protein